MGLNYTRGLAALVIAALPLASLTATFSVLGADAVHAGNGNGGGNDHGGNRGGRSSDRGRQGPTTGATAMAGGAPTTRGKGKAIAEAAAPRSMGTDGVPLPASSRA